MSSDEAVDALKHYTLDPRTGHRKGTKVIGVLERARTRLGKIRLARIIPGENAALLMLNQCLLEKGEIVGTSVCASAIASVDTLGWFVSSSATRTAVNSEAEVTNRTHGHRGSSVSQASAR